MISILRQVRVLIIPIAPNNIEARFRWIGELQQVSCNAMISAKFISGLFQRLVWLERVALQAFGCLSFDFIHSYVVIHK